MKGFFMMDSTKLILIVREYEELYNFRHSEYSNKKRRAAIWKEIGKRMNKPSAACKLKWSRIRDNHRKALNLRKTKSGESASEMKPPKFQEELQFLNLYINDDENRITNLMQTKNGDSILKNKKIESNEESNSSVSNPSVARPSSDTETSTHSSTSGNIHRQRKRRSKENKWPTTNSLDMFFEFFHNMARTVRTFPYQDQIQIKGEIFRMVHNVEMRLAQELNSPNVLFSFPLMDGEER